MIFHEVQTHLFSYQSHHSYSNYQVKQVEFFLHWNQHGTSCPSPQSLVCKIQIHKPKIRNPIALRLECSVISIDGNITDNIIRNTINTQQKNHKTKNGVLRNASINSILLPRFLIQNHLKSSFTNKWLNEVENSTWNSLRLEFVK